jgi:very-short-patch-repair endonuclease
VLSWTSRRLSTRVYPGQIRLSTLRLTTPERQGGEKPDLVDLSPDMRDPGRPPRAIAVLAKRQHGVVTHAQLRDLGLSKSAISRLVDAGRLHRLYRAVYAVGHTALTREGQLMAAVLACGSDAVLSHWSAGERWSMVPRNRSAVDVTVPRRALKGQQGLRVHQVRGLHRQDWLIRDGIPLTTPERTLLDLAEVLTDRQLRKAAQEAARQRRFNDRAIGELLDRSPGRRGQRQLRALLIDAVIEPRSRSELEDRFHHLVKDAGLERPEANAKLLGYTVDALWREQQIAVELDGFQDHGTRERFETDRERDARLQLAGFKVLRFTDRMLAREPSRVKRTLRDAGAPHAASHRRSPPPARGRRSSAGP